MLRTKRDSELELNITPLIDVVFLLKSQEVVVKGSVDRAESMYLFDSQRNLFYIV